MPACSPASSARRLFDELWGLIDNEEPPDSKHRDVSWGRLLLAGAIQGAIFRAVKEATDHGARRAFYRTTGTWPGEKHPDPEYRTVPSISPAKRGIAGRKNWRIRAFTAVRVQG